MDQGGPVRVGGEPAGGELDRERVAVDPDQVQCGVCGEQGLRVAAEAEVGVDDDGCGPGQRGSEQLQHALEHHRNVTARADVVVHLQPPSRVLARG